jgi:hypothetical protein
MTKGKPFRFSLRTLFVGLSVAAVSYFDEQGNLLGSLEWENGFIQKKGNERFIQGGGSGSSFIARDGVKSGSFLSDREGGRFFLEGKPVPRPRLDPLLLITKE